MTCKLGHIDAKIGCTDCINQAMNIITPLLQTGRIPHFKIFLTKPSEKTQEENSNTPVQGTVGMKWSERYANIDRARRNLSKAEMLHDENDPASHRRMADAFANIARSLPRKEDKQFNWGKVRYHNNRATELESPISMPGYMNSFPKCQDCGRVESPQYMQSNGNGGLVCRNGMGCN